MRRHAAFTLIELSIVLVIIGLITGAVLTGQSLIHAAQLRAITTESSKYQTALNAFHDRYFGLPGDIVNAVSYWGSADNGSLANGVELACERLDYNAPSTDMRTCNGDGDNHIAFYNDAGHEYFRAWQQLANAGLIEGQYTGVRVYTSTPNGIQQQQAGLNIPQSRYPLGAWGLMELSYLSGAGFTPLVSGQHTVLSFAGVTQPMPSNLYNSSGILQPIDAYDIDTKVDDGKPNTGKIFIQPVYNLNGCWDQVGSYLVKDARATCALFFLTDY